MTKEQAYNEYKAALKVALEKRKQYTYYSFKELNKELSEELLEYIADTCTRACFSRMQYDDMEKEIKYDELLCRN